MLWTILGVLFAIIALVAAALLVFLRVVKTTLPGPTPHPIKGCMSVITSTHMSLSAHTVFHKLRLKYGKVVGLPFPKRLGVVLSDGQEIMRVLSKPKTFSRSSTLKRGFGTAAEHAILILEGAEWKNHRRAFTPLFHPRSLTRVVTATQQACTELLAAITTRHPQLTNIPFHSLVSSLSIDVIGAVGFGVPMGCLRSAMGSVDPMAEALFHVIHGAVLRSHTLPWLHRFMKDRQVYTESRNYIRTRLREVLLEHQKSRGRTTASVSSTDQDLLTLLLNNADSHSWSESVMVDEMFMFYLAGHETSSNTLARSVQLLARHPEVLAKLVEEVLRVVGPEGTPVTMEHMDELKFTRAVYVETMRLHPTVPLTSRTPAVEVDIAGHKIPAGSVVVTNFLSVHRDPDNYSQPLRWTPDRWMPDPKAAIAAAKGKLFMFGGGPQACIGMNFARFEMLTVLARLAQWVGQGRRLRMSPNPPPYESRAADHGDESDPSRDLTCEDHELSSSLNITASPRHGVWIDCVARE